MYAISFLNTLVSYLLSSWTRNENYSYLPSAQKTETFQNHKQKNSLPNPLLILSAKFLKTLHPIFNPSQAPKSTRLFQSHKIEIIAIKSPENFSPHCTRLQTGGACIFGGTFSPLQPQRFVQWTLGAPNVVGAWFFRLAQARPIFVFIPLSSTQLDHFLFWLAHLSALYFCWLWGHLLFMGFCF